MGSFSLFQNYCYLCTNQNILIMTLYNPEEHHDEMVKHIAYSIFTGEELDLPYHPPRNDGKPSPVVLTIKDETYVINKEDFLRLSLEADEYAYKRAKLMVQDFEDFTTRQDALDNLWNKLYGHILPKEESSR